MIAALPSRSGVRPHLRGPRAVLAQEGGRSILLEGVLEDGLPLADAAARMLSVLPRAGARFAEGFRGAFTAIATEGAHVIAARSLLGGPLFHTERAAASDLSALLEYASGEPDPEHLLRFLRRTPNRMLAGGPSPLRGISTVPAGWAVSLGAGSQPQALPFDRVEPGETRQSDEERARTLRELLSRSLEASARGRTRVVCEISGGLDSALTAACATRAVQGRVPMRAYMWTVPSLSSYAAEEAHARDIAGHLGLPLDIRALSLGFDPDEPPFTAEPLDTLWYDGWYRPVRDALPRGSLVVSGLGSDHLFRARRTVLPELLRRRDLPGFASTAQAVARASARSVTDIMAQSALLALPRPALSALLALRRRLHLEDVDASELRGPVPWLKVGASPAHDGWGTATFPDRRFLPDLSDFISYRIAEEAWFEERGISLTAPFAGRDMLEFALRLPLEAIHRWDKPHKSLVREAGRELLPHALLYRKSDEGFFDQPFYEFVAAHRAALFRLVSDSPLVRAGFVEPSGFARSLDRLAYGVLDPDAQLAGELIAHAAWWKALHRVAASSRRSPAPSRRKRPRQSPHVKEEACRTRSRS